MKEQCACKMNIPWVPRGMGTYIPPDGLSLSTRGHKNYYFFFFLTMEVYNSVRVMDALTGPFVYSDKIPLSLYYT